MAAFTFKDLLDQFENELTCSICNEIFRDPRTLSCLHSFCTTCIESWCKAKTIEKRLPTCPHCRTIIQLPEDSVGNLPPSFYLSTLLKLLQAMRSKSKEEQPRLQCVSCEKELIVVAFCFQCNGVICEDCVKAHDMLKHVREHHEITRLNEFKRESVEHYLKNQGICGEKYHETEKLKFYCEDCKISICQKCAILDHKDHVKSSIEEAAERAEQLLENELEQLKQLTGRYEEELEFSKRNMERISRNVENTKTEVRREVKLLINCIKDQETAMIKYLDEIQKEQKADNQKEMGDIETELKRLFDFQTYVRTILNRNVACEILESQKVLLQRSQTLKEQPSVLPQQPIRRNMRVEYVTNQGVMQSFREIGKIVDSVTDPSEYAINLESLQETRCGFVNQFEIVTPNSATHDDMINITIKDSKDNEVKRVCCNDYGKLLVSFNVEKPSPYRITVTIGGQPICNSPQTIIAHPSDQEFQPVKVFGKQGKVKDALRMPWSLALSDAGNIAVVDCNNNCVVLFDIDGNFVHQFGNNEKNKKLLSHPCGITFCQERIIVSDQLDDVGRIQEFDVKGKKPRLLYKLEGFFPRGMCLANDNTIAVCCDGSVIQKP